MNRMNEALQVNSQAPTILNRWKNELTAVSEAFGGNLDYMKQVTTAMMLESTNTHLDRLSMMNEATQVGDVAYFKKYAVNILAAAVPNLIAHDIVSVQPMLSSIGEVRYLEVLYGSNKGKVKQGDVVFSALQGGASDTLYSSDEIEGEVVAHTGTDLKGFLGWAPVVPGTVEFYIDDEKHTDDGKGTITGSGISAGKVNYATGEYALTASSDVSSKTLTFNYRYNNMDK